MEEDHTRSTVLSGTDHACSEVLAARSGMLLFLLPIWTLPDLHWKECFGYHVNVFTYVMTSQ